MHVSFRYQHAMDNLMRSKCDFLTKPSFENESLTTDVMECTKEVLYRVTTAGVKLTTQICAVINNIIEWIRDQEELTNEKLCYIAAVFLVLLVFIWCINNGRKCFLIADSESPKPTEVISIFELAKTAHHPGHADQVMDLVIKLHFDVNFPIPSNGMTLFLCACISGHKNLVRFLLDKGGDLSITNKDGDTCLYLATFACAGSTTRDLGTLELLISAGCDVNCQNCKGDTPLHWAASKGDVKVVELLLEHGADPNIRNSIGMYPIGMATNAGHLKAGKLLKISPPDPDTPWDMFEPQTPVQVRLGLLTPQKDHLILSPRPKMRLDLS